MKRSHEVADVGRQINADVRFSEVTKRLLRPLAELIDYGQMNRQAGFRRRSSDGYIWQAMMHPAVAKIMERLDGE